MTAVGKQDNIKWVVLFVGIEIIIPLIHYLLGRKYITLALQFCNIQTVTMMVILLNLGIIANKDFI